jgi:hypothetical protein
LTVAIPDALWGFENRVNFAFAGTPGRPLEPEERIALAHVVRVKAAA